MLQIVRVDTLDNTTLDIELSNGSLILLDIASLLRRDPSYASLCGKETLPRPSTDGSSIQWKNGPALTLQDVFALLAQQDTINEEV